MQAQNISSHFNSIPRWMRRYGSDCDVVISSRVRLARNFDRQNFPHKAGAAELVELRQSVFALLLELSETSNLLENAGILPFEEFADWERQSLVERHLTSKDHIAQELGRALVALPDASLSLLINEEDHLRLQSLLPGLQLDAAFALADKLDDLLEKLCDGGFAYDSQFGYLTACPTNAGTGMRASVMLHLPALDLTGRMADAKKTAAEQGFVLRGTFGEGSHSYGHLYQLSNQITLGKEEDSILLEVGETVLHLIEMEREVRAALAGSRSKLAQDAVGRAYGTLRFAQRISYKEASNHLSLLRLGTHLGWLKGLSHQRFNELMVNIRPACLQTAKGQVLASEQRDEIRATMLRAALQKLRLDSLLTAETSPQYATRS
jgi:protein arginine kinase